jgi:hypothetical protein
MSFQTATLTRPLLLRGQRVKVATPDGEWDPEAALKAWVGRANPKRTVAELKAALKESLKRAGLLVSSNFTENLSFQFYV